MGESRERLGKAALMIAEFASANSGKESGVHSWIECALGPKWAFLGAWTYFFVNLVLLLFPAAEYADLRLLCICRKECI